MVKQILLTGFLLMSLSHISFGQNDTDDVRNNAHNLAKNYYEKNDYLNAYKMLIIHKYSHYDRLKKEKKTMSELSSLINYCEGQIKNGSSYKKRVVRGWDYNVADSTKKNNSTDIPTKPKFPLLTFP